MPELVNKWKTSDGRLFETEEDAAVWEAEGRVMLAFEVGFEGLLARLQECSYISPVVANAGRDIFFGEWGWSNRRFLFDLVKECQSSSNS